MDQEEIVDKSSNRIRMYCKSSINPPPLPFGLFISSKFQGGGVIETGHVLERERLFNLVKMVVSGPLRTVWHFF